MISGMAHSLEHIEYGVYISLMILVLSLYGISALIKGRKTVSTSVGWAALLALLPAWFTSAEIGVTMFFILFVIFFMATSKKNPGHGGENFLNAMMLTGFVSSGVSLYWAYLSFARVNYFSQMDVLYNSVYGLAPLFVFLLCFLVANRKERDRLEKERLEARRIAREQAMESVMEQREREVLRLGKEEAAVRVESFETEESQSQENEMEAQTSEEDSVDPIQVEEIQSTEEEITEEVETAAEEAEEMSLEVDNLDREMENLESQGEMESDLMSLEELFNQGISEPIEESALTALADEDATELAETDEVLEKPLSFTQGLAVLFGEEELGAVLEGGMVIDDEAENIAAVQNEILAKQIDQELAQEEISEQTVDQISFQEEGKEEMPEAMELEDFCIQQEEYFRNQYEFIIQQAEIFRKQKEYHQSLLDQSTEKFDFYNNQADMYLKQIDYYRAQREQKREKL